MESTITHSSFTAWMMRAVLVCIPKKEHVRTREGREKRSRDDQEGSFLRRKSDWEGLGSSGLRKESKEVCKIVNCTRRFGGDQKWSRFSPAWILRASKWSWWDASSAQVYVVHLEETALHKQRGGTSSDTEDVRNVRRFKGRRDE